MRALREPDESGGSRLSRAERPLGRGDGLSTTPADLDLLARGELRLLGLLPRASNYAFLGEVSDGARSARVVYKPRDGEIPLWDFPEGTLCQREVAAYRFARALGWPNVPPTILRDGPHGEGSAQLYVDHDPTQHYFTVREQRREELRAVAAFDVVAGNGDRKAGHCLVGDDGRLWVVDHGLCFNEAPLLRTVIWDYAGQPVPAAMLADVRRVATELERGGLRDELVRLLGDREIEATAERARELVARGTFPHPGPGRSEPWPPL